MTYSNSTSRTQRTSQGSAVSVNTQDNPWPVGTINTKIKQWVERLGHIWVEGQITQISTNPRWSLAYMVLRDTAQDKSIRVVAPRAVLGAMASPIKDGDKLVLLARPQFYENKGELSLYATEIHHIGEGELLARIERLKKALYAEGLFDKNLKKTLPFLPRKVGLITGRGSHAEQDVLSVSQDRWKEVRFEIINTPVQGPKTVSEVIKALDILDADPDVEVIIIARGGGSVEDLLPFSVEDLIRHVSRISTPVVSAIGHEPDNPLLDYVADLRAATPTDAAKRVVPDVQAERALLQELRQRSSMSLISWLNNERRTLRSLRERPVLAYPHQRVEQSREQNHELRRRCSHAIRLRMKQEKAEILTWKSQLTALGPAQTLERGYSIVQVLPRDHSPAEVVTTLDQVEPGSQLRVRVRDGSIMAAAMSTKAVQ